MKFTFFFGGDYVSPDAEKILQIEYVSGFVVFITARSCMYGHLITYQFLRDASNQLIFIAKEIDGQTYVFVPTFEDDIITEWAEYTPGTGYPVGYAKIESTLRVY